MFISRKRYELICEIVVDQDKKIKELQNTIDDMKIERIHTNAIMNRINNERSGLIRFISSKTIKSIQDIDFPNSEKGGFEGSDIFEM